MSLKTDLLYYSQIYMCLNFFLFIFSTQMGKAKIYLSSEDTVSLAGNETASVSQSRQST